MNASNPPSDPSRAPTFQWKLLMVETFLCTLAMMSFVALIGPIARTVGLAPWQAGAAVTLGGVTWALFARPWGVASDRYGRRSILLRGLAGFVLSYAAMCGFIVAILRWHAPTIVAFVGVVALRGIAGAFYAAVPATASALVADHVPPEKRAGAMAMLGAASGTGMVVGPGLAGLLATRDLALPLVFTAALPAIAWGVLWRGLPRKEHRTTPKGPALKIGDVRLRRPLTVAFVAMFSVAIAQVTIGFFALDRLRLDPPSAARAAGIGLTVVGVGLILAQTILPKLGWSPARLIRWGSLVSAVGFASVVFATTTSALWAGYFFAAAGMGWVYPSISALAANSVEHDEQGATAGTVAAAQGLGMIVGPLAGTLVYGVDSRAPYALVAGLLSATALWPAPERPRGSPERQRSAPDSEASEQGPVMDLAVGETRATGQIRD